MSNYYVLYCQNLKIEQIQRTLKKYDVISYIPRMEKYLGSKNIIVDDVQMFPGYLFVVTDMNQKEFDQFLISLSARNEKNGILKELSNTDVSALTEDEIDLLSHLLDDQWVMRMSCGYKEGKEVIVYKGPLVYFRDKISKINTKDHYAMIDVTFMNRSIKAGLTVDRKIEI